MAVTRRSLLKATGAGALAGGALGLAGCVTTNEATGRSSFTGGFSPQDDMRLGAQEHPKLVQAFGGEYSDKRLQGYVERLGLRLARYTEYQQFKYRFTLLNSPIVNAFALPGGYVYVSRGLMSFASNEAELCGVLAHELGHVNARHSAERIGAQQLAGIGVLASAIGASLLGLPADSIAQVGQTIATLAIQGYSREQELEADTLGVRYMSRAGYDPDAMVTFLTTLREQSQLDARAKGLPPGSVDEYNMLSTHPRTVDRVRLAQQQAQVARPKKARLDRKTYLAFLDGMLFGDDPDEGIVMNDRFVHPGLRFEFKVPRGFRLQNSPERVVANDPSGAAVVFDIGSAKNSRDPALYLQREWATRSRLQGIERITVNGLRGATGATVGKTREGNVDVRLVALARDEQSMFRLMFLSPRNRTAALNESFRRTTWSFRRLSAAEAAKIKPLRIEIREARQGERLEQLAKRLPYGPLNADWFRVLNDLPPGAPLPRGRLLKTIAT